MGTAHARFDALAVHGEVAVDTDRGELAPAMSSASTTVIETSVEPDGPAARSSAAAPLSFAGHRTRRCARRWEGFLALAESRGLSADEVAVRFDADDIADLCAPEHDDAVLERCMDTLADAVRRERGSSGTGGTFSREGGDEADVVVPQARCGACHHFRRRSSHPHLGDCAEGVPRTAAGGFWDDQLRGCDTFVPGRHP